LVSGGLYAAVPFGKSQLMIIHNGQQLQVCRTESICYESLSQIIKRVKVQQNFPFIETGSKCPYAFLPRTNGSRTKFQQLFEEMYQLCEEQGRGDPFSYARSREIHLAGILGHKVAETYSGADAVDQDGE
jgi:hypothetical protein